MKSGTKLKTVETVTCSSGIQVVTKPVSLKLLELFELNHREPDPPMVEANVVGGGIEMVPNPEDPAYLEIKREYSKRSTDDFLALILDMGVDVSLPEDDAWERKLKRVGVTVPEDQDDRRLLYIQTIVMPNFVDDLQLIASSVLRQSGADQEAIDSWVALF